MKQPQEILNQANQKRYFFLVKSANWIIFKRKMWVKQRNNNFIIFPYFQLALNRWVGEECCCCLIVVVPDCNAWAARQLNMRVAWETSLTLTATKNTQISSQSVEITSDNNKKTIIYCYFDEKLITYNSVYPIVSSWIFERI